MNYVFPRNRNERLIAPTHYDEKNRIVNAQYQIVVEICTSLWWLCHAHPFNDSFKIKMIWEDFDSKLVLLILRKCGTWYRRTFIVFKETQLVFPIFIIFEIIFWKCLYKIFFKHIAWNMEMTTLTNNTQQSSYLLKDFANTSACLENWTGLLCNKECHWFFCKL